MKSITAIIFSTTLMFGNGIANADPVADLTAFAADQIAEQAVELKNNMALQIKQSLQESLVEVVSLDTDSVQADTLTSLDQNTVASVE